jgi:DNA-binding response OmpR family regulator
VIRPLGLPASPTPKAFEFHSIRLEFEIFEASGSPFAFEHRVKHLERDSLKGEGEKAGSLLVVGDEKGFRQSLRLLLEPRFRVFAAESGEQAVEIVRREEPDVVTLDLRTPGLSAVETLARIRDLSPSVEVVVVTDTGSHEQAAEALRLRAFDYVTKSADGRRILEIVERAERNRQSRLLRTEEDPCVVAGEIAERLGELDFGLEDEDHPKSDRLKLDYTRLLANAVRDRTDPDPSARIQALIEALENLQATVSQSGFHDRVVHEALQTLGRICKGKRAAPC